jgi:hypothetical protein
MKRYTALYYSGLTFILSILASGIAGRALWCDEMLRIFGQRMTLDQLFRYEHLKYFCTQSPVAYLIFRPWQLLFGMETGGFIFSALCAAVVTCSVLVTLRHIMGRNPTCIVCLIVASNPFLVYYGSELAFYSLWSVCAAISFALMVTRWDALRFRDAITIICVATLYNSVHFAGIFIWIGISAAFFLGTWLYLGWKSCLYRIHVLAIPVIINIPMYVSASKAPQHLGSSALHWDKLGMIPLQILGYMKPLFPSLTGGWWFGLVPFVAGVVYLFVVKREFRKYAILSLGMIFSISLFLTYTYLRDYGYSSPRYWIFAVAPALTLVGLGIYAIQSWTLKYRILNGLGLLVWGLFFGANMLVCIGLIAADGRNAPYKKLQNHLSSLEIERSVISINYYENRFFGGYYTIPNQGTLISPATWEEGKDARIRGMQRLCGLIPDIVLLASNAERYDEIMEARLGVENRFQYQWPRLLHLAFMSHLYPEPGGLVAAPAFFYSTRDSLVSTANATGQAVSLPASGLKVVAFRNPKGEVTFALLSKNGSNSSSFDVYIPPGAKKNAYTFTLELASYRTQDMRVQLDGKPLQDKIPLPITESQGYYIPKHQQFKGLPNPDYLVADGMQFVLAMNVSCIRIPLDSLSAGWHTLTFATSLSSPWMAFAHECAQAVAKDKTR